MKAIKVLLTHSVLAISALSLSFCAPPVQDFGTGIHKINNADSPQDVINNHNAGICASLGFTLDANGNCSSAYPTVGIEEPCSTISNQAEALACANEQQGVEESGGQFWGALLAVTGQEVLRIVQGAQLQNVASQSLRAYAKKKLNVLGTSSDDYSINPGTITMHRLQLRKFVSSPSTSAFKGMSSLQFELTANGDSIATFNNQSYGKTLLMCLNASFGHDEDRDNSTSDTRIALQMRAKYNSFEKPLTWSKQTFLNTCNALDQEQSYIGFQLNNSAGYHVYAYNPKKMGFSRVRFSSVITEEQDRKYTVVVDGEPKELRYYAANNELQLGIGSNQVITALFTDAEYGSTANSSQNQALSNKSPGTSNAEQNFTSFNGNLTNFQKQYLYLTGTENGLRVFCSPNSDQTQC